MENLYSNNMSNGDVRNWFQRQTKGAEIDFVQHKKIIYMKQKQVLVTP